MFYESIKTLNSMAATSNASLWSVKTASTTGQTLAEKKALLQQLHRRLQRETGKAMES